MRNTVTLILFLALGLILLRVTSFIYEWIILKGLGITLSLFFLVILTMLSFSLVLVGIRKIPTIKYEQHTWFGLTCVIIISLLYSFYGLLIPMKGNLV